MLERGAVVTVTAHATTSAGEERVRIIEPACGWVSSKVLAGVTQASDGWPPNTRSAAVAKGLPVDAQADALGVGVTTG